MTDKEMLLKLIEQGKKMRHQQIGYFSADRSEKRIWLIAAKQAEKEFDNTIFNIEQLLK